MILNDTKSLLKKMKAGSRRLPLAIGTAISFGVLAFACCVPPRVPAPVEYCMNKAELNAQAERETQCKPGALGWRECEFRKAILSDLRVKMDKCWEVE